jgi:glycosyltransferase involved in cell wall biosynthesis
MIRRFFQLLSMIPFYLTASQLPITMVIPSYNNEKWVMQNLNSVLHQNYSPYRILYVNDCSGDQTSLMVEQYLQEARIDYHVIDFEEASSIEETTAAFAEQVNANPHFFTLINNKKRAGALANLYRMIHSCHDEEIVVTVDGDDWLAHNAVLSLVNETYCSGEIWFTHGTMKEHPWGHVAWSEPVPEHLIAANAYREFKCPSHLRTFYAWLFKKIKLDDFLYQGEFYPMTWDMAIMYPLGEMAGERHAFIKEPIYIYNMENAINDNKVNADLQNVLDAHIRKLPRYMRLEK